MPVKAVALIRNVIMEASTRSRVARVTVEIKWTGFDGVDATEGELLLEGLNVEDTSENILAAIAGLVRRDIAAQTGIVFGPTDTVRIFGIIQ